MSHINFNYPRLKIHPVFYTKLLKPYYRDVGDPNHGELKRVSTAIVIAFNKNVECILVNCMIR